MQWPNHINCITARLYICLVLTVLWTVSSQETSILWPIFIWVLPKPCFCRCIWVSGFFVKWQLYIFPGNCLPKLICVVLSRCSFGPHWPSKLARSMHLVTHYIPAGHSTNSNSARPTMIIDIFCFLFISVTFLRNIYIHIYFRMLR